MICMSALLLLAVSCKKDNEKQPQMEDDGFTATIELQDDGSKTHLEGNAARWDNGDQITVCSNTYSNGYTFTSQNVESGNITAHFAGTNIPNDFFQPPFTAFYGNVTVSNGNYTLRVPAEQNAVYNNGAFQNTFASGANPMAARSNDKYLHFKNICGILELKLYNTSGCHVDEIVLTAAEGVKLNGTGTVDMSSGTPVLGALNGGNTITLKCNGNLSTNANNPSHFYFVLPPVTLTGGFTITVKDGSKVDTRTVSTDINIQRSHIKPMEKLAVAPAIATPEGAVKGGVFTVNSQGKQVYFSKGNLTYNVGDGKWRFYENQTDIDAEPYNHLGSLISLFTWGYGAWSTGSSWSYQNNNNFTDWGSQPIANGGNTGGLWRTLTNDEWCYLVGGRRVNGYQGSDAWDKGRGYLWTLATVNGIFGAVIFPDGFSNPTSQELNYIPDGCAFLPAAGIWNSGGYYYYNNYAQYWASDRNGNDSYCMCLSKGDYVLHGGYSYIGSWRFPVRLVQDVP